jgi:hypothetical protein
MYISGTSDSGEVIDVGAILVGAQFRVIEAATLKTFLYEVSSAITDNTGWFTIPITIVSGAGTFANNKPCSFRMGGFGALSGLKPPTTPVTSTTYTTLLTDKYILANNSAGVTVTLIAAATAGDGYELTVKNINALGVVTVDGDGTETIDGELTKELTSQYDSFHMVCDGSNWNII